jgi:hypothetical protein
MIFVIDNLKYDTDKMELISEKCDYNDNCIFQIFQTKIWRSKKGNWLVTYTKPFSSTIFAESLTESEVKCLLLKYDLSKYEELFGKIEEA